MAKTNSTLMLLLTCFIGKSNLLFVIDEPQLGNTFLNDDSPVTEVEENHLLSYDLIHNLQIINPKNQVEDFQSDDVVESGFMLEERFRHPTYFKELNNEIFDENIEVNVHHLNQSHSITVFACVLAILLVGVVLAIFSWRFYLKKQFIRRHILVSTVDDVEHF